MDPLTASRKPKEGSGEGSPKEPHGDLPKNRRGEPCGRCARIKIPGLRCPMHGGKSTGPKTADGKQASRQNAEKHGLKSDPQRFVGDLGEERRRVYEDAVHTICEAEAITNPLEVSIVRSIVIQDMLERGGIEWLLQRGFFTVEAWRGEKLTHAGGGSSIEPTLDIHGQKIPEPAVPEAFLGAMDRVAARKAKLYEALRAGTGQRGDAGKRTIAEESRKALRDLFAPDAAEAPP